MRKCVVLLSGGLDSATCLAMARADGFAPYALTVDYGQRHHVETDAAKRVAVALGAVEHRFIHVDLNTLGGSALTADIDVPKDRSEATMSADIPITYVPARNTVMLALALGFAEVIQADANPGRLEETDPAIGLERTRDTGLRHVGGTLSMARDTPDSATSDIFICIGDQPELDFGGQRNPDGQGFAAFGQVTRGMEVVRAIQHQPADGQTLTPPIRIQRAIRLK